MRPKICVITGSRADYGLLYFTIKEIQKSKKLELQLIASGSHLSHEFGLTYKQIEQDKFNIDRKIEILLTSDTSVGTCKSIGLGVIGFSEAFTDLTPDMILVLGDRFEIFAASIAALILGIPIAHIHGGELTEGNFDNSIRHCITKMSHIHFSATEKYCKRIIQLGELPENTYNVGGLGVEHLSKISLLTRNKIQKELNVKFEKKNYLVTYHPETLNINLVEKHFRFLLETLKGHVDTLFIFTKANADSGGRIINEMIDEFVSENGRSACAFVSMGQLKYLSTMKYMDGVIGNSSSGIIEAPSLKIGTINIGDRQKGREQSNSVINCRPTLDSIKNAFITLRSDNYKEVLKSSRNPYERKAMPSVEIRKTIEKLQFPINTMKSFYDIELSNILPMN